jgi:ABC-2 type transport system ATP-binding protein
MRGRLDLAGALVAGGTTLLLTTQYLEEADRLADRIELTVEDTLDLEAATRVLAPYAVGELQTDPGAGRLTVPVASGAARPTTTPFPPPPPPPRPPRRATE